MKKILGIIVLSLLLSGNVYSATLDDLINGGTSIWYKVGNTIDDINPLNYFKKRKKCQARADRQDTVAEGKKQYKRCMDNPNDYWNEKNFSDYNLRNVVL